MSHFPVLVITSETADEALTRALAPFHEFECTGVNDEYVVDVDQTEEVAASIAEHDLKYALEYYGLEDRVVADESEVDRQGAHEYGFAIIKDGKLIKAVDRTNPNKKWDWWQLGGRWKGALKAKAGAASRSGQPGTMGTRHSDDGVDACRKGDLDLDGMRRENVQQRLGWIETAYAKLRPRGLSDAEITTKWARMCELHPALMAQWEGLQQKPRFWDWAPQQSEEFRALMDLGIHDLGWGWDSPSIPTSAPDPFVWANAAPPMIFFAFLGPDGIWREKGRMGWWAMVSGEKKEADWDAEFAAAVAGCPDDYMVWVVDCHI